ncbi:PAS domain S-box-containing protein [Paucidesulfovibrio gracilis DSM 16080]|uniref:histidine kinase n=1 Tax=Paucidesulfovibrio gracilis DSM 16080 TaxID=1121449 RepID=A0A1T4XLT0_9BACT|nr:PAS domain S-box protein [Paucidesulfovibrio gracilis]SKA90529.1 PAS domain S-box-containing protein [Paucidesulfovibrio gracilis DSM 16080]
MKSDSKTRTASRRLWSVVTLSLLGVACLYVLLFAQLTRERQRSLLDHRRVGLKRIVSVAYGALQPEMQAFRSGRLSKDEALERIAEKLWSMRYPDGGHTNYLFLLTMDGVPLVNPANPEQVQVSQWHRRSPDGKFPVQIMVEAMRRKPDGAFVHYMQFRPGRRDVPENKVSYIMALPGLDCFLGTGAYMPDLWSEAWADNLRTGGLVLLLFSLAAAPLAVLLRDRHRRNRDLEEEIHRRERVARSQRSMASRYRMIVSRPGQVVYDMNLSTGETHWFGDSEGVSGHSLEEYRRLGGRFFESNIHPSERESIQARWNRAVKEAREWYAVFRLQTVTPGKYVYVEDHAGFLQPEEGSSGGVRMIGSLRNVDPLVRAGEEVRRSEAKYRILAQNFPNGAVLLFDDALRFVLADGSDLRSVGVADGGMIGRTPAEVFPPSVARMTEKHFRRALQGEEHVFEMTYAGRIFKLHVLPVRGEPVEGGAEGMVVIQDVTSNKLAEKALSESERRLSTLIMNMPGMVYRSTFQSDWTLEFVSPGCRAITGYGSESLLYNRATSWSDLVHPEDREHLKQEMNLALAEGRPYELIYRINTAEGRERWVWERGVSVGNGEGVPVIEGIVLDVTDRKHAEEGLARSLAYETVLNSCATLLLSADRQKDALDGILPELRAAVSACRAYVFENFMDAEDGLCCRQTFEAVGPGVEPQLENPDLQHVPYEVVIPRWREVLERGELVGLVRDMPENERIILESQSIKSVLVLPLRVGGEWSGFVGFDDTRTERTWTEAEQLFLRTATDMVGAYLERLHAEQRLLAAHGELDQIFNSTGDGMALLSLEGTVLRVNRTMGRMFGIDPESVTGQPCSLVMHDDQCGGEHCPLGLLQEGMERSDHVFQRPDPGGGVRHFRSVTTPFRNVEGEAVGVVVSTREITERVRAQEAAKERERQLVQADKLAALGTLVSGVAHEINNPNGIITLNAPTLRDIWKDVRTRLDEYYDRNGEFLLAGMEYSLLRDEVDGLYEQIVESARRIKRIVSELKDFARQESPDRTAIVDMNEVAEAARGLVDNKIRKSTHRFTALSSPEPALVEGNFQRLEQVLVNALINACEALTSPEQAVTMEVQVRGNSVVVTVSDEGKGMASDEIGHVFEPFFTTKRDSGGTGLGLSVSHGIIDEHGGRMEFSSEEEQGTVCVVELPRWIEDAPRKRKELKS